MTAPDGTDVAEAVEVAVKRRRNGAARAQAVAAEQHAGEPGPHALPAGAAEIVAHIDHVSDRGYLEGWAWVPKHPIRRVAVTAYLGGELVSFGTANSLREDVREAGFGDGLYGFSLPLPDRLRDDGSHLLSVRFEATGAAPQAREVERVVPRGTWHGDTTRTTAKAAEQPGTPRFRGHIDGVDARWRLSGWLHDPTEDEPLVAELVEGSSVLASARANDFREDLLAAGIREGKCAFYIRVPAELFDGKFRNLQLYGVGSGHREPVDKPFGIVFPRLGPLNTGSPAAPPAIDIFAKISGTAAPVTDRPGPDVIEETSQLMQQLGRRFGHAAALGLLYAYVLRRPIDNDGLVTRLTRIHSDLSEYKSIVEEVMYSEEATAIHGPSRYLTLHPLTFLTAWLESGFGILQLAA